MGEILLNSMDADGTRAGFDLRMIAAVRAAVDVPVIASGGAGRVEDFALRWPRAPTPSSPPRCSTSETSGSPTSRPACGRRRSDDRPCLDPAIAARLKRDADGLVCAVAQQRGTGEVLMVAWNDDEVINHPHHRPRDVLVAVAAGVLGEGLSPAASRRCTRCGWTATAMPCCWGWTRLGAACHTGARTCFDADVLLS